MLKAMPQLLQLGCWLLRLGECAPSSTSKPAASSLESLACFACRIGAGREQAIPIATRSVHGGPPESRFGCRREHLQLSVLHYLRSLSFQHLPHILRGARSFNIFQRNQAALTCECALQLQPFELPLQR